MKTNILVLSLALGLTCLTLNVQALEQKKALAVNKADASILEKHNWSTSEREKKNKQRFTEFATQKKLTKNEYNEVCAAFVNSGKGEDISPPVRRHWLRKSPRQFSKPHYSRHIFGRTSKQHVCFTTRKHIKDGGSGEALKIKSLKK